MLAVCQTSMAMEVMFSLFQKSTRLQDYRTVKELTLNLNFHIVLLEFAVVLYRCCYSCYGDILKFVCLFVIILHFLIFICHISFSRLLKFFKHFINFNYINQNCFSFLPFG
ncbi:hypothetical protein X975_17747, partial [Stegodyphus mimosarum]